MTHTIAAICTGTARPFNGAELSAFIKRPRDGVVQILEDGFAPDEQADRRVHGGPEKAVHLYPLDHHAIWRAELEDANARALLDEPGAFGTNLSVAGITETDVFIGDRFRLGSALLEVNQPRQPCWKIDHRFGVTGITKRIIETGRSGWYFRVLEPGEAQAGDRMERIERGHAKWSLAQVFAALIAGTATRAQLEELAILPRLSPQIQAKAIRKLG